MFDVEFARSHFPALTDDWALFDNAGGSVPLAGVIERVRDYMSRWQVQLGATYQHSATATALVAEGRRAMARLVNASADEVVIGPSSTMNVRTLSRALLPLFSPGDEIVVTNLDHETNIGAWRELENEGVRIREWRFDPERLELTLEGLEPLLGPRTRLVCFTHCSSIVGTIHDAAASSAGCTRRGGSPAWTASPTLRTAAWMSRPSTPTSTSSLSTRSSGPTSGCLRQAGSPAPRRGPRTTSSSRRTRSLPSSSPGMWCTGWRPRCPRSSTTCWPSTSGTSRLPPGAGPPRPLFDAIARHEAALAAPLLDFLRSRRGVRVIGGPEADTPRRAPTISFVVNGRDSEGDPPASGRGEDRVRYGHFFAHRAIEALGLLPGRRGAGEHGPLQHSRRGRSPDRRPRARVVAARQFFFFFFFLGLGCAPPPARGTPFDARVFPATACASSALRADSAPDAVESRRAGRGEHFLLLRLNHPRRRTPC